MLTLILASTIAMASARPSYIAVPADQIAFVDLRNLHLRRVPRQTLEPPPPPQPPLPIYQQENYQPIDYAPQKGYQTVEKADDYQPIPILQYGPQRIALAPPPFPPQPIPARFTQKEPDPVEDTPVPDTRPPDFGEYVDFGGHTGDSGAFGWYADYPVNNHDNHYN